MKRFFFLLLLASFGLFLFSSCSKEDDENPPVPECNIIYITDDIVVNTTFYTGNVYIFDKNGDLSIEATLTIEPGVVVKSFRAIQAYIVKEAGKVIAQGTADNPIIFTSQYDNSFGCDMSGDGTTPKPGDWGQFQFYEVTGSVLSYCHFYFGGGRLLQTVEVVRSSIGINNCVFAYNKGGKNSGYKGALDLTKANIDCEIRNNVFYANILPVSMTANLSLDNSNSFSNPTDPNITNQMNGIFTNDYTIDYDVSWSETEVAFVVGNASSLRIEDMASLTLGNDVVIKVVEGSAIDLKDNSVKIINYDGQGVYFTSIRDDSRKGDANGDGSISSPATGDWKGIMIDHQPLLEYATWPNIFYDLGK